MFNNYTLIKIFFSNLYCRWQTNFHPSVNNLNHYLLFAVFIDMIMKNNANRVHGVPQFLLVWNKCRKF